MRHQPKTARTGLNMPSAQQHAHAQGDPKKTHPIHWRGRADLSRHVGRVAQFRHREAGIHAVKAKTTVAGNRFRA